MGMSVSILLAAAGPSFCGRSRRTSGVIDAVGVILLVVGIIGAALSLVFWSSWGGFGGGDRRDTTVISD